MTASQKAKRGAGTIGGAVTIILGWLIGDVLGYEMPDYVLQAWTVVTMAVITEFARDD